MGKYSNNYKLQHTIVPVAFAGLGGGVLPGFVGLWGPGMPGLRPFREIRE